MDKAMCDCWTCWLSDCPFFTSKEVELTAMLPCDRWTWLQERRGWREEGKCYLATISVGDPCCPFLTERWSLLARQTCVWGGEALLTLWPLDMLVILAVLSWLTYGLGYLVWVRRGGCYLVTIGHVGDPSVLSWLTDVAGYLLTTRHL